MLRAMTSRRSPGVAVNGIILLDKPQGLTSNGALQRVKRLFNARKAGHTGSLDPLATGMLPLCLGEATKMSAFLLEADKRYEVTVQLGVTTTTGDAEGEVIARAGVPSLTADGLESLLATFRGIQSQTPPMHSAIKVNGQPLYKLARAGKEIEREPREINIHSLELLAIDGDRISLSVHCSKGTYIRTLAEDIGGALGCGGHVAVLRRTTVGPFLGNQMVTLETLERVQSEDPAGLGRFLLPAETAIAGWPGVRVSNDLVFFLSRGEPVFVPQAPTAGWVRIYRDDNRFVGVGQILDDGRVSPKRLLRS